MRRSPRWRSRPADRGIGPSTGPDYITAWTERSGGMRVIAHRGFADDAPENTVRAVRAASGLADGIEVDLRRCGSGEVVVIHDERVDRVTAGTGRVADLDLAALRSLSVCGTDERIPTLREVLEAADPGTPLYLELKETGLAADVLAAVGEHGNPAVLISFDPAALGEVRALDDSRPTGLIASRLRDRPVRTAADLGCVGVHLHYRLCLLPALVGAARARDLEVNAWPVRLRTLARLLAVRGVDGLSVDSAETVPAPWR